MVPIPVIVNAGAGRGHSPEDVARIESAFRAAGLEARVLVAPGGRAIASLVATEVAGGAACIVAGGGDGTINAVAAALRGSDITLGILPLGTLNHFARDLGVPLDLEAAARVVAGGTVRRVDLGEVNGKPFLNNSSVGLYPEVVRRREAQRRRQGRAKWHAMGWAMLTMLRRAPFLAVRLSLGGVERELRTPIVFVGNNAYVMEGFNIGTRDRLDCGTLSIYSTTRRSRAGLVGLAVRALFGRLRPAHDFLATTAESVRIATRHRRLPVATDGEVTMMDMPLDYRVLAGAQAVFVPGPAP